MWHVGSFENGEPPIGVSIFIAVQNYVASGNEGIPKSIRGKHQLLRDLEDGQLEGTRLTHNRTFRGPSERRDPGSIQLCNEQRPKQQAQLSLRGPYTEEASSKPLQDELYRVDFGVVSGPERNGIANRYRKKLFSADENDVCN